MRLVIEKYLILKKYLGSQVLFTAVGIFLLVGASTAVVQFVHYYEAKHPPTYPSRTGLTIQEVSKRSVGTVQVQVFGNEQGMKFTSPFSEFFGGAFRAVKEAKRAPFSLSYAKLMGLISILALLTLIPKKRWGREVLSWTLIAFISLASIWLSFRLSIGQDEFFTNLKHALSLKDTGSFSLNEFSKVEGTVDFLPFFAAGLFGRLGLPLADSLFTILLLGNILLIVVTYQWSLRVTQARDFSLIMAAFMGLFPNVVYMGMSGFTSVLFSSIILSGIFLTFYSNHSRERKWGLFLLGTVTLFRTEGALLSGLLWICDVLLDGYRKKLWRNWRQVIPGLMVESGLVIGPFLLSCFVRFIYFGHLVPTPIPFKAANGDIHYLAQGLTQFWQVIRDINLDRLAGLALVPIVMAHFHFFKNGRVIFVLGVLAIFSLVYFSGGGDWLWPSLWNRYSMPFSLYFYLVGGLSTFLVLRGIFPRFYRILAYGLFLIVFMSWYQPHTKLGKILLPSRDTVFSALQENIDSGMDHWSRIDRLASFGQFLSQTTPIGTSIASPEVSTIMYFANRDVLDLLGVANQDIAMSPLDPLALDYLAHRKRAPQVIQKYRPGIIALCEPVEREVTVFDGEVLNQSLMRLEKQHFNKFLSTIAYYRAGSYRYLEALGYKQLMVLLPNLYFNYYVSSDLYSGHLNRLRALGFQPIGVGNVAYEYNDSVVAHFSEDGRL